LQGHKRPSREKDLNDSNDNNDNKDNNDNNDNKDNNDVKAANRPTDSTG